MLFHEPMLEFIEISQDTIILTSNGGAGYTVCERVNGANIGWNDSSNEGGKYCEEVEEEGLTWAQYCAMQAYDKSIDVSNPAKTVVQDANSVITPASTAAPVRSAPHFNNDLFK